MRGDSLHEVFVQNLRDLYDAEKQLVKALPKMAKAATNPQVQEAVQDHLEVTKKQVARLERVFASLGEKAKSKPCRGMQGLIEEGEEHLSEGLPEGAIDTAIVGGGQKIEHYEMAGYQGVIEMAGMMGHQQAARLLQQTFREEERMARKLTQVSARLLKEAAREIRAERSRAA